MTPFTEGDWLRWSTHHQVREGQVVFAKGRSLIIRWLDGEEQVFPFGAEPYLPPMGGLNDRMEHIEEPKGAARIERDRERGVMSIARAASIRGTTPKRIRAMIRSGQLEGRRGADGKWAEVYLDAE